MELKSTQTSTTAKLPMLKQGDYETWRLRIEQYFQVQDSALCDVIENGNFFKLVVETITNDFGTSTTHIPGPVTTKEKAQKKNDVKARKETTNEELFTQKEEMEIKSTQTSTTVKLPMLKQGDYETWRLRIEQYFQSYMAEDEVSTNMALMDFSDFEASKSLDKLLWSQITDNSKKGLGYEICHVVPPLPRRLFSPLKNYFSYSGLEEFQQPGSQSYRPKSCETESKNASKEKPNKLKESPNAPLVKDRA
nr:ribonuclease H-like domain-containing protein [Tanacetum cinerariifolium]